MLPFSEFFLLVRLLKIYSTKVDLNERDLGLITQLDFCQKFGTFNCYQTFLIAFKLHKMINFAQNELFISLIFQKIFLNLYLSI